MKFVYAIEGLDRLGKSSLIEDIIDQQGFYQVIHFGKPKVLQVYQDGGDPGSIKSERTAEECLRYYQYYTFLNSMKIANSGARVIFDRWHLGEAVYAPLYRGYDGDYVFDLEARYQVADQNMVRLILLVEDFTISKHFVSDGGSFDDSKREAEQQMFIDAFNKSTITDKRMICVTDPATGEFRSRLDVMKEALA